MKTIKKYLKQLAIALSFLILLQGCVVYKSAPITLEQAAREELKVKVTTKTNEKLEFNRISFENDIYYGNKRLKGEIFKTPLEMNMIDDIKVRNNTISTFSTISVFIIALMSVTFGAWRLGASPL